MFNEEKYIEKYVSYQPNTRQSVADHIVNYVRQKRPVNNQTGRLNLAVDVACGTGQNTFVFARHFDQVLATDLSEEMIKKAIESEEAKTTSNVKFAVSPAEDLSLVGVRDKSVDLLMAAFSFHWFDGPKFFAELRRVLAPNGVLAIVTQRSFPFIPTDATKTDQLMALKADFAKALFAKRPAPYYLHHYRTTYDELEFPLEDIYRGAVETSYNQLPVTKVRFLLRNCVPLKEYGDNYPDELESILQTYQDRLMDIIGENERKSDPSVTQFQYKTFHHVILGRMNTTTI